MVVVEGGGNVNVKIRIVVRRCWLLYHDAMAEHDAYDADVQVVENVTNSSSY